MLKIGEEANSFLKAISRGNHDGNRTTVLVPISRAGFLCCNVAVPLKIFHRVTGDILVEISANSLLNTQSPIETGTTSPIFEIRETVSSNGQIQSDLIDISKQKDIRQIIPELANIAEVRAYQ